MKKQLLFVLTFVLALTSFAQTAPQVVIPSFRDKYCEDIKKLEAGETDIDYQSFRYSFIESKQFKLANKQSAKLDSLEKEMYAKMKKSSYQEIIAITKQMLSIDYTNMMAHKILRQTYKIVGDSVNATKYKAIQFGLLNSIVKKGDGKTCATAWPVIQISEEYFILEMIDADLEEQSIENDGGVCDKMKVLQDGNRKTYYFETSKVFEGYEKMGMK